MEYQLLLERMRALEDPKNTQVCSLIAAIGQCMAFGWPHLSSAGMELGFFKLFTCINNVAAILLNCTARRILLVVLELSSSCSDQTTAVLACLIVQ